MTASKPNILIIMVDQLNGTFFPDGPADWLHAPQMKALAARSARFRNNYTSSPLCAPARASFMAGQLPSRTQVYDNAAEYISSIPTFAHHLRRAGYYTALSGKMHFVGPDQLHGFEERLTTDIYPADFGWTPDYRKPGERIDWWYHNMGSVTGAGVAEITNQMEYDDEVAFLANQKLYQLSRENDDAARLAAFWETLPDPLRRRYVVTEFVRDELPDVFAMADLVVSRSGAGTVAELELLGKPSILVPLPGTGGDEATKNARVLERAGAAIVVEQKDATPERLAVEIDRLLADRPRLASMAAAAKAMGREDAAASLADELFALRRS